ncbi:MAG TPA: ABC transporter permease [Bryobacteraceae bacterium]|nr:ABC transporter permease [Bryobacteraceae bacterium]
MIDDIRQALRRFRTDPMLALTATLTLAVCIGANTTVFSIVNSILLRPLPYPGSKRIYWVREQAGKQQMEFATGADYYSLRDQNRVFEDIAAFDSLTVNWTGIEKPQQLDAARVTPSFFRVMATQPLMGRYFAPEEQGVKAPPVVVLSYAFWHASMASDPHAVGKTILLDRVPNTIIGVMPQGFDYPQGTQVFRPMPMDEANERPRSVTRPMRLVNLIARLKPGVTPRALQTELARLAHDILAEYPKEFESAGFLAGMKISAQPLQDRLTGDLHPALLVLSGAVGLVLLIACVNIANLLLARAGTRRREVAVRLALGSGRARIIRQMLAEAVALAVPGGIAGAVLAYLAVVGLNVWKPLALDRYPVIAMDLAALAFTIGLTLVTGVLFGMAPAAAAVRVSIHDALKSGGQMQSGGRRSGWVRRLLVVAELGISLVLLIGAGLLARSFVKLASVDLGFPPENLLTMRVNLVGGQNGGSPTASAYATAVSQRRFYDDVLERVKSLPMVRRAAASTDLPIGGGQWRQIMSFQIAGRPPLEMAQRPEADLATVSPDYFQTLGIPLREGRNFGPADTTESDVHVLVNEAFVRKILPGENPIGQRLEFSDGRGNRAAQWTIVGVAGNHRGQELGAEPIPLIYRCICQNTAPFLSRMAFIVRTTGDPHAAVRAVEAQVYAVDRNQPVFDVKTMDERLSASLAPQRFQLLLIGAFALIAIVLAALGVYGVMSYLVTRRTREIGIRMAMGARPVEVERLIVGEIVPLAILAAIAGLGGAWALTRYLKSMLYGVAALDTATFAVMPVVLIAIAAAASLIPARRAARIDPMSALREE